MGDPGETRDRLEEPLNLDAIRDNLHYATQVRLQEAAAMRGVGEDLEALLGAVSRLRERVKELEAETPEWTPLSAAMQKLYEVWDVSEAPNASTEDLIFAAEGACEAWKAYRQARFGNAVTP